MNILSLSHSLLWCVIVIMAIFFILDDKEAESASSIDRKSEVSALIHRSNSTSTEARRIAYLEKSVEKLSASVSALHIAVENEIKDRAGERIEVEDQLVDPLRDITDDLVARGLIEDGLLLPPVPMGTSEVQIVGSTLVEAFSEYTIGQHALLQDMECVGNTCTIDVLYQDKIHATKDEAMVTTWLESLPVNCGFELHAVGADANGDESELSRVRQVAINCYSSTNS